MTGAAPRYQVLLTHEAIKDVETLTPKLRLKLQQILDTVLTTTPHAGKRLVGDLAGNRSLRLTYQDRILYRIDDTRRIVYVKRARTHYGE
ncbi:MAG: toxin of toxin-antitoxin system [Omnitrophica bacterium RIFCSPHIGHO2_02_FULL_63_14]|nr:MAG: toxin of toxin-antitoxin system [Omnitrophica bacterium RIFCSPHIGHO2_02_FULL_63_14]